MTAGENTKPTVTQDDRLATGVLVDAWYAVGKPTLTRDATFIERELSAHRERGIAEGMERAAVSEQFLHQLRRVSGDRAKDWVTNPVMLCEHCGATEGSNCIPPFKNQLHSFTKPHPYLTKETPSDPLFWAVELGGEVGEILNVVKKLRREELGWKGSRSNLADLADELADGLICLDSLARHYGIDLADATASKFNKTSEKVGFPHRLAAIRKAQP